MDTKILEQIEELFSQELALVQHDFKALGKMLKEKMQLLGQGLLQRVVNKGKNGYQGSSIPCKCGNSKYFVQYRQNKYLHSWDR